MSDTDTATELNQLNAKIKTLVESAAYIEARTKDDANQLLTEAEDSMLRRKTRWQEEAAALRANLRAEKQDVALAELHEKVAEASAVGAKRSREELTGSGTGTNWQRPAGGTDDSCKFQFLHNRECHEKFADGKEALKEAARARTDADLVLPPRIEGALAKAQDAMEEGTRITEQQNRVINLAFEQGWQAARYYRDHLDSIADKGASTEDKKAIADAIAKATKEKEKEKEKKSEKEKKEREEKRLAQPPYGAGGRQYGGRWGSGPWTRGQGYGQGFQYGTGTAANAAGAGTPVTCYRCGGQGHYARTCTYQIAAPNGPGAPTAP